MDFQLTESQRMVRDMVRKFADDEVRPIAAQHDRDHTFPMATAKRMGELGLLGITVPEQYGGPGADYVSFALVAEELARADASHSVIFGANASLSVGPILTFGTEEQKQRFLPKLASGEYLGCYALTEPEAGSDAGSLRTSARREGDHYVIDGQKQFISNGAVADVCVLFARTDPKTTDARGVTAFLVDTKSKGFKVGRNEHKLGLNASYTNQLFFEGMEVPAENRLGKEGEGFKVAMATLDTGRIMAAAGSVGIARAAFEDSTAYAKERRQFGKPIASNQAIQWKLADMDVAIEAGRNLYLKAAWLKDQGQPFTHAASRAKLYCSEMAMKATIDGVQIHGGNGYTKDYAVERYMRDIKIFEIFEGTSEVQRLVIARHVLGQ
ncbi:MAG: acyl-CoA dehydrogenase [Thermoplasmata archaeon]|jgi:alkylation response protein AidB-like acyl-CoA dehydrogenase|nr:acyl-CoA dehydrogenase [Thermoplasmata archaeon]